MKKLYLLISILVFASLLLSACQPAATPTEAPPPPTKTPEEPKLPDLGGREITIAIENAYLPFNYVSLDTGEAEGWDYDFIDEACKRLNCTPVWIEFGWDTMIAAVGEGQFDMAADGITITDERAKVVDFSDSYIATEQRLLVKMDDDRFEGPDEFAADSSAILAQQVGTTNYAVAVELVGDDRIRTFDDYGVVVQSVFSGDVDGTILDEVAGLGYLGANKGELKLIGRSLSSDALGFIFTKGSDLVEPINLAIAEMWVDGWMEENNMKWFGPDFTLTYDDIGPGAYAEEEVEIGTEDSPIQMLFVPSVTADVIVTGGELLAAALTEATGLFFEVSVPTSYAATIEEMCASPDNTIAFIPAMGYAIANSVCGVVPGVAAERYGWNIYWTQFIVARDSEFQTFEDLEGASWAYPDAGSTSGFLYPSVIFDDLGITVGEQIEAGGHPQAANAVYNGEADFATTYFSPPLLPEGTWTVDMSPDIPDDLVGECAVNEDDRLFCGGWRVLDARAAIRAEAPDVVQKVRILGLSPEIPNDTMSFSPDFPEELRQFIIDGLMEYVASDVCLEGANTLCSEDFYNWTAVGPIFDENFDGIRLMMESQGITLENYGG